jgi:hypothetical protein
MASDLLTQVREEIAVRMSELRPLLAEYERLLAAAAALAAGEGGTASARPSGGRPAQPSGAAASSATSAPRPTRRGQRGRRGSATGAIGRMASTPTAAGGRSADGKGGEVKRERAPRGAAQQAIVAALEHGSHTVGELAVVTAMSGPNIRGNLRRLLKERTVTRTKRDGKAAYALSVTPGVEDTG